MPLFAALSLIFWCVYLTGPGGLICRDEIRHDFCHNTRCHIFLPDGTPGGVPSYGRGIINNPHMELLLWILRAINIAPYEGSSLRPTTPHHLRDTLFDATIPISLPGMPLFDTTCTMVINSPLLTSPIQFAKKL
jgi:hypothetical protein